MNQITTADDFPTIIDAIRHCNDELNRIGKITDKKEAQQEMVKLWHFHDTVLARIEREKGGDIECTIPTSKSSSPICESNNYTGRTSRTCAG